MYRIFAKIKRNYIHEFPLIRLYSCLYLIGVLIGVIAMILLHSDLLHQTDSFFSFDEGAGYLSFFMQQFLFFLLLYLLGLTVIGVPLLPFYPMYKGFSLGLLISLAVILSGVRGLFFGTLAFFAQNILYTVLGYFICYSSARLSISLMELLRGGAKHTMAYSAFLSHTVRFAVISIFLAIGSLWEWKVVPLILKMI